LGVEQSGESGGFVSWDLTRFLNEKTVESLKLITEIKLI
jgi:hypothetical protein